AARRPPVLRNLLADVPRLVYAKAAATEKVAIGNALAGVGHVVVSLIYVLSDAHVGASSCGWSRSVFGSRRLL
ncbi:unnamed protein product, partial [Urochloa humidicola]